MTLREHLVDHVEHEGLVVDVDAVARVAGMLDVTDLLDMPLVVLSNGQTRRARIARALLSRPETLILEEPFSTLHLHP